MKPLMVCPLFFQDLSNDAERMWGYDERMLVIWVEELCRRRLR